MIVNCVRWAMPPPPIFAEVVSQRVDVAAGSLWYRWLERACMEPRTRAAANYASGAADKLFNAGAAGSIWKSWRACWTRRISVRCSGRGAFRACPCGGLLV